MVFRKPNLYSNSIEYLFHTIYQNIHDELEIREFELPQFSIGLRKRIHNVLTLLRFRKCIVHITGDSYYAILGAIFCKRLITIHDLSFLTRTTGIKRKVLKLFWITLPTRFAHKIVVVSETTKQALLKEQNLNPQKIQVIYNFIDPVYKPVERKFNKSCPRILQVGVDFNKNIDNLVKALEGIACTLVIIGRLSESQKELLASSKINYINKYALTTEELHSEYVKADMMTFISTVEGFGLPILEAQATGLPVVTSNCSSMIEVAGEGALLVNPFNVECMHKGILELSTNEKRRLSCIAVGYVNVKRFSKEKIVSDYLRVYQSL